MKTPIPALFLATSALLHPPPTQSASGIDLLTDTLTSGLCYFADELLKDLPHTPLYASGNNGQCEAVNLSTAKGVFYSDSLCTDSVNFSASDPAKWCEDAVNTESLGDAGNVPASTVWTLTPGTRLDIGVNSIAGNTAPFMSRANYRQVAGNGGTCNLEMRVYKKSLADTGLKPLLMIHGGSWQYRGSGYIGQEALVSHYTEAGFAVFAPFYRLAGNKEAGPYCNGVTSEEILADVDAALAWVQQNAARFGAANDKVALSGQSAGAYLAASLATRHAAEVDRALLLYPPTDFVRFLQMVGDGADIAIDGQSAVEAFLGRPIAEMNATDPDLVSLSLPRQVENLVGTVPPMFMVHGAADTLVPADQSVRLCNALAGSADNGNASDNGGDSVSGEFRNVYSCDDQDSQLHIAAEGQHVLDVCVDLPDLLNNFGLDDICPAGNSDGSLTAARASLQASLLWLSGGAATTAPENGSSELVEEETTPAAGDNTASSASGGGGALGGGWLVSLLLLPAIRRSGH